VQHGGTQEPIHQITTFINTYACVHALHRPCLNDRGSRTNPETKKLKYNINLLGLSSSLIELKGKEQIKFSKFLFLENCSNKEWTSKSTHNKRTGKMVKKGCHVVGS
jgi:hypothetical protein